VDPARYTVQGFGALIDKEPGWYEAQSFDYLIFSSGRYDRYFHEPDRYPDEVARYNSLFNAFSLVKTFPDERYEIRIYSVP
jgi:hypothetical protein